MISYDLIFVEVPPKQKSTLKSKFRIQCFLGSLIFKVSRSMFWDQFFSIASNVLFCTKVDCQSSISIWNSVNSINKTLSLPCYGFFSGSKLLFCEICFWDKYVFSTKNCHFWNITNLKTKTLGTSQITRQERMKDVLKWNQCFVSIY
jgi:hypothetical protein